MTWTVSLGVMILACVMSAVTAAAITFRIAVMPHPLDWTDPIRWSVAYSMVAGVVYIGTHKGYVWE